MTKLINIETIIADKSKPVDFANLDEASFAPAVKNLIAKVRQTMQAVIDSEEKPTWENVVDPLDNVLEDLQFVWSIISHLNSVVDTPSLREIVNSLLPDISLLFSEIGQNEALYAKYKAIKKSKAFKGFTEARKRIIDKEIEGFVLSGAELPKKQKKELMAINERASSLSQKFSENLLDCTNEFALYLPEDTSELIGVPDETKALFAQQAKEENKDGYKITLQFPNYLPIMQYAVSRKLREDLYHAFSTRASEFSPAGKDNAPIIDELLQLRVKKAKLLGFNNFAELSLERKMADSPKQVVNFLEELASKAKPAAEKDMKALIKFGEKKLCYPEIESWDISYISEKLREAKYSYSAQEVKQYFTLPTVLNGLFGLVEKLFSISIKEVKASVWHQDVKYFVISDKDGKQIASFYADLYARSGKRGGAWMNDQLSRRLLADGKLQLPVAYLVCNFAAPVGTDPSLLTLGDVETIFHEFGHGLHHMLTRQTDLAVSGINGVEWDAVEMPSQFMENFVLNWEVMQTITSHVKSGEKMPRELFDKIVAAKNFQAGMGNVRQIEFALFDMKLHMKKHPRKGTYQKVLKEVRKEVAVNHPPKYNRFANSFSHIFAGGYAAGYYSYKWAEVLSADAFSLFEEKGIFNKEVGRKWLDEVLSRGGSRSAMKSFVAFRGRKPSVKPLLRQYGLIRK